MNKQIISRPEDKGKRLDTFLAEQCEDLTRNMAQIMIESGRVTSNEKVLKKNYKLSGNEVIDIEVVEPQSTEIVPENLPLDIVYEDADIIVINKKRGMVVHPAVGNWTGTLVNALMYHCGDRLSGINGEIRPGIVHRIDKDTSGLLVVAKNDFAHQHLADQIARHEVKRDYEAVLYGILRENSGTINQPIGRHKTDRKKMAVIADGKPAITHYNVLKRYTGYTHTAFALETGRTHQIRVHAAFIGHPIIGDPVYGVKKDRFTYLNGQCLHANHLTLMHPRTNIIMEFDASRPDYFESVIAKLESMS
ncbi:RluA family pseudouridine synthase [Intestinibacillus sp. Marseille-P6563]|uniref:RluA family pseudouridine synthase n=1 Tax=Intestinibacillus sp. Marseille-P6563 TaxID=2364792 RepID=UPI000F067D95|nr:RluA family pseudouridine synthase [Intestinibacillus sp. Marseille-P6563]